MLPFLPISLWSVTIDNMSVKLTKALLCTAAVAFCTTFTGCSYITDAYEYITAKPGEITEAKSASYLTMQDNLYSILNNQELTVETRFAVIARIANNMLSVKDYNSVVLFLTEWVESHPEDQYNAYWLLMTAHAYLQMQAEPMAEYYFERIINNYDDLLVHGQSVHFKCYQNLIKLNTNSANRITYFNQLISRFSTEISTTEMYYRLAMEYEAEGEWDQAIKALTKFLHNDDASSIVIAGYPNAYTEAKQLIDFNNSSKNWTFETLDSLLTAVTNSLGSYNWMALDRYRSKVNFFAISWRQDEDTPLPDDFSIGNFMFGNKIRWNTELDEDSSPTEAYLRTTGWSNYISTWYLYFRKVNFPADPDIHGRWEWAGIYYGEKL